MKAAHMFLLLAFVVTACNRDPDVMMQRQIEGTWVARFLYKSGDASTSTITFLRDGRYECQVVSSSGRHFFCQGTYQVQHGFLTDTMTNSSTTNAPLPTASRARIIRIDDNKLHLRYDRVEGVVYPTNEAMYLKVR